MKKLLLSAVATACMLFVGSGVTFAQDDGVPQFRPVEMWVCSYRDGKDQGDFDDVLEDLVKVEAAGPYAAFRLFPSFRTADQDFDFLYLGVWPDGSTMGSGMANYGENGGDVEEAWDSVADCPTSVMYASMRIQDNDDGDGSGNFMLTVSDCKVGHALSNGQAIGALSRFNDYRVANGSTVGTITWFPVYGGGGADFDFKLAHVYSGAQHFGDSFQWFVDNQAYLVQQDMLDGIVSCDVPRVYIGETIMNNMNLD